MGRQNRAVLSWLESHSGLTTAEATDNLRIFRLSERVRELERMGIVIDHVPERTSGGARVVRYVLCRQPV